MDSGDEALEVVYEEGIEYPEHPTKPTPPQLLDNDGSPAMKAYITDMQKYNTPPTAQKKKKAAQAVAKPLPPLMWIAGLAGGVIAAIAAFKLLKHFVSGGGVKEVVDPVVESSMPPVLVVE